MSKHTINEKIKIMQDTADSMYESIRDEVGNKITISHNANMLLAFQNKMLADIVKILTEKIGAVENEVSSVAGELLTVTEELSAINGAMDEANTTLYNVIKVIAENGTGGSACPCAGKKKENENE